MNKWPLAVFPLILLTLAQASAAGPAGYHRFPTLHGDTIVFTAEGDLWTVGVSGGTARRLTSHPGAETSAAISPDGATVAFSRTCPVPVPPVPPYPDKSEKTPAPR